MGGMGGMGGGMGGMGGGFRSLPPTGPFETTLEPGQVKHLATPLVSLNGPGANAEPLAPAEGEKLRIGSVDQATDDLRTSLALKRLAAVKAPQTISQMVLWYVTAGADWDDVGRLAQGWGNAYEVSLAREFVANLSRGEGPPASAQQDPGNLYWEIKVDGDGSAQTTNDFRALWKKHSVLGLTAKEGVPTKPMKPALACWIEVSSHAVTVNLCVSHSSGTEWVNIDRFQLKRPKAPKESEAPSKSAVADSSVNQDTVLLADAVAEAMLTRLVRVQLNPGPVVKTKKTYQIKIVNESPMILNGVALAGAATPANLDPTVLQGLSVPPLKSLTLPASAEAVNRLNFKKNLRAVAADLSGL
jgi:hypothetical protein